MWFYADNKSKPMSPTMTPKALNKTGTTARPGSPRPIVLPKPGSPRPPMTLKPGSPRPPMTLKPISPRPPLLPRPPMTLKPGKPISPIQVIPGKPVSPTMFKGCPSSGSISVPHVKYTLHQKPVVFEKVSKCVTQNQVPITYEYEKKQHPVKVVKSPCGPCGRGRKTMSPVFGHGGHIKAVSPCGAKQIKYPCAMQDNWHLNRPPCDNVNALGKDFWNPQLKETHMFKAGHGHHGKWWMGKNSANSCNPPTPCGTDTFPRWQSQYVPQGKSPCMVATMGNCQRKRCGNC